MKAIFLAVLAGLVVLAAVGLWAVLNQGDDEATAGFHNWTVETARGFDEFPVYWVGQNYKGLPLVQVARMDVPEPAPGQPGSHAWNEVSFTYGDCTIAPGEESCPMPLSIDIRPYCDLRPEQVAGGAKVGPPEFVRGALVQRIGGGARIWTSNVSIGISTTGEVGVDEAISALVRLNGGKPATAGEALGPPDKVECP